jgi:hypothetical protein
MESVAVGVAVNEEFEDWPMSCVKLTTFFVIVFVPIIVGISVNFITPIITGEFHSLKRRPPLL